MVRAPPSGLPRMPSMQPSALSVREELVTAERELRTTLHRDPDLQIDVRELELGEYWTTLFRILAVGLKRRLGVQVRPEEIAAISAEYQRLI
jgi:hypothetical protein